MLALQDGLSPHLSAENALLYHLLLASDPIVLLKVKAEEEQLSDHEDPEDRLTMLVTIKI